MAGPICGYGSLCDVEHLIQTLEELVQEPKWCFCFLCWIFRYLLYIRKRREDQPEPSPSKKRRLNLVLDDPEDREGWEEIEWFDTYHEAEQSLAEKQDYSEEAKIVCSTHPDVKPLDEVGPEELTIWIETCLEFLGSEGLKVELFDEKAVILSYRYEIQRYVFQTVLETGNLPSLYHLLQKVNKKTRVASEPGYIFTT